MTNCNLSGDSDMDTTEAAAELARDMWPKHEAAFLRLAHCGPVGYDMPAKDKVAIYWAGIRLCALEIENEGLKQDAEDQAAVLSECGITGICICGGPTTPQGCLACALRDKDEKIREMVQLLVECRDALPAISLVAARLHNVDLRLADRIERCLEPWRLGDDHE